MVADSTTDSQLFHGSLISRAFLKKPNANWLRKLKQWKIDDPRRSSQWIHQRKRANVVGDDEEEDGYSSLNIKTLSYRFSQACMSNSDDDDETGLSAATSSPTSAPLKNKDSNSVDDEDCFSCSKEVTIEEEVIRDANDNSSDDPSQSNESSSNAKPPENPTDQKKKEDEYCPICTNKMDATDLLFKPCSNCVYKICLFCYNTIKEDTGVCPGCRNKYEQQTSSSNSGVVTFQQPGGDSIPLSSSFQGLDSA